MKKLRTLIVDDEPLAESGWPACFRQNRILKSCGSAATGKRR